MLRDLGATERAVTEYAGLSGGFSDGLSLIPAKQLLVLAVAILAGDDDVFLLALFVGQIPELSIIDGPQQTNVFG